MNEEALGRISAESFKKLEEALHNPETTGIEVLAAFLNMPDEDFEIMRPIVQDLII